MVGEASATTASAVMPPASAAAMAAALARSSKQPTRTRANWRFSNMPKST